MDDGQSESENAMALKRMPGSAHLAIPSCFAVASLDSRSDTESVLSLSSINLSQKALSVRNKEYESAGSTSKAMMNWMRDRVPLSPIHQEEFSEDVFSVRRSPWLDKDRMYDGSPNQFSTLAPK